MVSTGDTLGIKFIDRLGELSALNQLAERGAGVPIFVYGPEGCGKTRLLKEFLSPLASDSEFVTVYVDALETQDLARGIYGTRDVVKLILDYASSLKGPIGVLLAYATTRIMSRIEKSIVKNKHVVIVVDDIVKSLGLDKVEIYMKNLLKLVEYDLAERDPESILVIATTSEGLSLDTVMLHPTWTSTRLVWNLDYRGARELIEAIGFPGDYIDDAWALTGGNPRALIQVASIYNWNLDLWVRDVYSKIRHMLLEDPEFSGMSKELIAIAEDPDVISRNPSGNVVKAHKLARKYNLIIYKATLTLTGDYLNPNPELGIGEYYAWQLPVYPRIIKEMLG